VQRVPRVACGYVSISGATKGYWWVIVGVVPSRPCWSRQQSFVNKENTVLTNRNKVSALADERPAEDGRGRDLVQASGWRPTVNRDGAERCEIFTNVRKALV
jgi:hypothetical protein